MGLLVAVCAAAPASAAPSCPWTNPKLSANHRAHELVSAMTIDQKIAMLSQAQPGLGTLRRRRVRARAVLAVHP